MKRKENRFIENQTLIDNMRKIQKASGLRQGKFYMQHLRGLPGAPVVNTEATGDNTLSEIMNGARPVPVSFLPVYAKLGGISIDRLLTGSDFTPGENKATYGDVLQLLYALLSKDAAEIRYGGGGIVLQDPALVCMLGVLGALDQMRRDGFDGLSASDMIRGLLQHEEMQAQIFDASRPDAAAAYKLTAEAIRKNDENARDKMLRLIRCTAPRKVSK